MGIRTAWWVMNIIFVIGFIGAYFNKWFALVMCLPYGFMMAGCNDYIKKVYKN